MRITILGSGTGVPTAERQPAGVIVTDEGHHLLVDSGSGTVGSMARAGIDYRRLETLVYTHAHADHSLDLVAVVHALNFTPGYVREDPLEVIGPPGFSAFVGHLLAAYPTLTHRGYALNVEELDGGTRDLGWARLVAAEVPHGNARANAYRLATNDGVVVFSGDCSPSQALVDLARDADLFLCEASFPTHVPEGEHHLTTEQAALIAEDSGAKTLVLTHFYPWTSDLDVKAEAERYYSGQVIAAKDNLVLDLRAGQVSAS
jgi:ribonuclease Z